MIFNELSIKICIQNALYKTHCAHSNGVLYFNDIQNER